jgi:hypothetical protein
MPLHIIKLVVGCDNIEELVAWHAEADRPWIMHTRMTPKRVDEVLAGGSLYRVMKGQIVCRQTILKIDTVGEGQASRCEVTVDPNLVRVVPTPAPPVPGLAVPAARGCSSRPDRGRGRRHAGRSWRGSCASWEPGRALEEGADSAFDPLDMLRMRAEVRLRRSA